MPNFDALRSAIIGPLEYICKPSPPKELLGCWNLYSDYQDKSIYRNSIDGPSQNLFSSSDMQSPFDRCWGASQLSNVPYSSLTLPLSNALELSQAWSIDWVGYVHGVSGFRMILGDLNLSFQNAWGQNAAYPAGINFNGSNIKNFTPSYAVRIKYALRYTGAVLYYYEDGALKQQVSASIYGSVSQILMNADGHNYNGYCVSNLRVVQKALGTANYYPAPSALYTGYEVL